MTQKRTFLAWVPISKAIFQLLKLASKYLRAGNGRWIFSETEPVLTWKIGERQPQFLAVLKLLVAQNLTIGWAGPTTPNYNKLNTEISKANSWFKLNGMQPNIKKTKHLLIGTTEKLYHSEITTSELSLTTQKNVFVNRLIFKYNLWCFYYFIQYVICIFRLLRYVFLSQEE